MLEKPPLLSEIFKEIRMDIELKWSNWPKIFKKNERFAVARRTFSRTRPSPCQLSEYLASPHLFQFIRNTAVQEEIDKLSQNLLSAKKIFKLRRLGQRRKMEKLSDCYLLDGEFESVLSQIFEIFRIENHIGTSNKDRIATWILDTVLCREAGFKQRFVYKEAPFARAFRSKSVMSDKLPVEKRGIQMLIVNNLMAGVFWWTLIAIRQCISVIPEQRSTALLWRSGHLEMLKNEMTDFRRRYHVRRLKHHEKAKLSTMPLSIGRLKFTVIRQKLRPVFPKTTGMKSKYAEFLYWKRINSMIDWCFNQKGIDKRAIRKSCRVIYRFLREKQEKSQQVTAFTADITKCFSTLKHSVLIDILVNLIDQNTTLYSVCGRGRDNLNRWKVIHCTATSGAEVVRILKQKMKLRKVEKYEQNKIETSSTKWLLNELRSSITSYYFNRGKTTLKVTKGVPQGHPLSSHLAHVYLNEFEQENWKKIDRNTVYARYEDDYVICTTDKSVVKRMLHPLFSGENPFGLVANREKSQISSSNLKWCGVDIDLKNCRFSQKIRCNDKKMRQVTLTEKQLSS